MPVEEFGGGPINPPKPKPSNLIPTAPSRPPRPNSSKAVKSVTGGTARSGSGRAGQQKRAGQKRSNPQQDAISAAAAAESRALSRERSANRRAAQRSIKQAQTLEGQAKALQRALRKSFGKARDQQLSDITQAAGQQAGIIREGYRTRYGALSGAAEDNELSTASQTGANERNRTREQSSAMSELASVGGGESDALRAQLMSLRNWNANQLEVNRAHFDTLRSINSSLSDLNIDTKSALANNQIQARADKEAIWTNYYDRRSEALTQLGNVRGQQADYYNQAVEYGEAATQDKKGKSGKGPLSRGAGKDAERAAKQADRAFMAAARTAGRSWDNPGISQTVQNWTGRSGFTSDVNQAQRLAAQRLDAVERPEGATLRKW